MHLISFKQAQFAHAFVDYMAIRGITIRIEQDHDGNSQLFYDNEDEHQLAQIKNELAIFLNNPYDKRYTDATWQVNKHTSTPFKNSSLYYALPKISSAGLITTLITIICIVLYGLLLFVGSGQVLAYLGYPQVNQAIQFWRFLTPILIHFSLLHIIFNLMWWWYLGGMVEKYRGKLTLLEILLISGVLSNYAQAAISGPYFGGLSGVVYALMGYVWLYGERVKSSGLGLDRVMIGIAVIWLLAGYIGLLGAIANTAHLVGLIVGLLLAAKDIWLIKRK